MKSYDYLELMWFERNKAFTKALAELETARLTYYSDTENFIKLETIISELKKFQNDQLR